MQRTHKTRITVLFAVLLIAIAMCGCIPYTRDRVAILTQMCNAVPGALTGRLYTTTYDRLETDDYGRQIIAFINPERFGAAVFIMQKSDSRYVYYYDTISYQRLERRDSYTEEQLDDLKAANDWNLPLDESKMIKREHFNIFHLSPTRKSAIEWEAARDAFTATMGTYSNVGIYPQFFDYSQSGQEMYHVVWETKKPDSDENEYSYQYFLMVLNADGTYDPENYIIKIEDPMNSNGPMAEIKERNGWFG